MPHHAKKSLGQNFLKSETVLRAICEAGELNNKDIVLEIGPGKGALTKKLLEKAGKVIAIEKDRDLVELLKEKFAEEIKNKKLELIEGDCLAYDPKLKNNNYKLVANIPYNITGAILKKFLSGKNKPSLMVLLVQKEVADRIVARDGKESILSISVKVYGTPTYIMKVSKRFFSPSPKVDSAVIKIKLPPRPPSTESTPYRSSTPFGSDETQKVLQSGPTPTSPPKIGGDEMQETILTLVRAGFAHKRKVLIKNLETVAQKEKIAEIFKKLNLDTKVRAEDLKLADWQKIGNCL